MAVSLQKGQKVSLTKETPGLSRIIVGLGWDEAKQEKKGLFGFGGKSRNIDCDASALVCANGKIQSTKDVVFYNNLTHPSGAVQHMGDNLTGAGEGDDEQIIIDLDRMPEDYDRVVMAVTIYQARERNQHFGMIQNSFIRLVDARNNQEICRYNLTEQYNQATAVIFGEVYRHNGEWKFNAMGQPTQDGGIAELVERFR
ncbi:MAG: TerD family protein [Butyricicoccus pullicaecorum]|nr:TerD family protein [Butyricicoccus pullicaecorum]MDO4668814.1 TerD family protein [Butyricicoccus pullicaecorum]